MLEVDWSTVSLEAEGGRNETGQVQSAPNFPDVSDVTSPSLLSVTVTSCSLTMSP